MARSQRFRSARVTRHEAVSGLSHHGGSSEAVKTRHALTVLAICVASPTYAQPEPTPPPLTPPTPPPPVEPAPPPAPTPAPPAAEPAPAPLPVVEPPKPEAPKESHWYDKIKLRGYTQVRYNRLPSFDSNDSLINRQGDRSIGKGGSFLIRRARLVLSGDVHDHVSIYLQPDFASSIGDQGGVGIVRDWYADLFFDKQKELRLRVGQSKVPYGFENLQSSQNRLPLDRNDALNSAVRDERDLGAFLYWTPPKYRKLFKQLVDDNLKGTGDYGIVGIGIYNGQTANQPSDEGMPHVVGRVSVPIEVGSQLIEVGGGGYYGKYTMTLQQRMDTTYRFAGEDDGTATASLVDTRAFGTFVLYPKPLGVFAEYTFGRGPQQGRNTPTLIDSLWLHGGYALVTYKFDKPYGLHSLMPFVRGTYYNGGKKFFANAPHYVVKELELGLEAQIFKALEVVVAYDIVKRTSDSFPYDEQSGQVTRVQVQVNY